MTATSYGWFILAFPLAGMLVVSLGWRLLPGKLPGWIASGAILGAFLSSIGALDLALPSRSPGARRPRPPLGLPVRVEHGSLRADRALGDEAVVAAEERHSAHEFRR